MKQALTRCQQLLLLVGRQLQLCQQLSPLMTTCNNINESPMTGAPFLENKLARHLCFQDGRESSPLWSKVTRTTTTFCRTMVKVEPLTKLCRPNERHLILHGYEYYHHAAHDGHCR